MFAWMKSGALLVALIACPLSATLRAQEPATKTGAAPVTGTLTDSQPLAPEFSLDGAAQAFAIRYTSTDGIAGSGPVSVTGALFIPKGTPPKGGWPLVAWAHGTVGVGDNCAPSRNARSARDRVYLDNWLGEGYAVVATDYQGLGSPGPHPYGNSRATAYSTLDSIRAVLGADFALANKVLLVGQSQGAAAVFATAGYAPSYAPDVNLRGTVATGLPNLTARSSIDAKASSGGKPDPRLAYQFYLATIAQQVDPNYDPKAVFSDRAMQLFEQAADTCIRDMGRAVVEAGLTPENSFKADFRRYYAPILKHAGYPTLRISTPVFVGAGAEDIDTPTAATRELADEACSAGSKVELHIYPGLDHSGAVNPSFQDSRVFARRVMAGEAIVGTCSSSN